MYSLYHDWSNEDMGNLIFMYIFIVSFSLVLKVAIHQ